MTPQKQKGTSWESAICDYLRDDFPSVCREPLNGSKDIGDINLATNVCIQAKNQQRMELSTWVDAVNAQGKNRGSWLNVVWHHRPRKASPADAYVTMDGATFKQLLKILQSFDVETAVLERLVKRLEGSVK
jgi:hypothetical protein